MYSTMEICYGREPMCLKATIIKTLDGIHIYVGGGEKAHIGTVVMSQPRASLRGGDVIGCTTSVLNHLGHKDDEIAVPMAEAVCKHFNEITVVTAGIHIDDAEEWEINTLKWNAKELISLIVLAIEDEQNK